VNPGGADGGHRVKVLGLSEGPVAAEEVGGGDSTDGGWWCSEAARVAGR
jgi:hypothetical protein